MSKIDIKELSDRQREILNKSISLEEIQDVINATKLGKVSGPDGYTAKFYRRFKEELSGQLHSLFNQILEGGVGCTEDMATGINNINTKGRKLVPKC